MLPGIAVQVQNVIKGLEENDDSQGETPMKLEPGTLELSPKTELQETINFSDVSISSHYIKLSHVVMCFILLF